MLLSKPSFFLHPLALPFPSHLLFFLPAPGASFHREKDLAVIFKDL